jgi:hypothetical protein
VVFEISLIKQLTIHYNVEFKLKIPLSYLSNLTAQKSSTRILQAFSEQDNKAVQPNFMLKNSYFSKVLSCNSTLNISFLAFKLACC